MMQTKAKSGGLPAAPELAPAGAWPSGTAQSGGSLGWLGLVRLALVQSAIGAIAVLSTVTLNRVMVVELALPASLPAALVAWHYVLQLSRPAWGHAADKTGRFSATVRLGLATLALGSLLAADATAAFGHDHAGPMPLWPLLLAVLAFALIGAGVAGSGTALLTLIATRTQPARRPAAAAIAWVMMIAGIVVTAGVSGHFLDPYSPKRLIMVTAAVAGCALLVGLLALGQVERRLPPLAAPRAAQRRDLRAALTNLWTDRVARRFTAFVFVSMLAYSAEELLIEPFAGLVFNFSLGRATSLAAAQHGGVLVGMILCGGLGIALRRLGRGALRAVAALGAVASAMMLLALAQLALAPNPAVLAPLIFLLGFANGIFTVAALGTMMALANGDEGGTSADHAGAEAGLRMGAFGAAQALAFAVGGVLGASGCAALRVALGGAGAGFAAIFAVQAVLFLLAAGLAAWPARVSRAAALAAVR